MKNKFPFNCNHEAHSSFHRGLVQRMENFLIPILLNNLGSFWVDSKLFKNVHIKTSRFISTLDSGKPLAFKARCQLPNAAYCCVFQINDVCTVPCKYCQIWANDHLPTATTNFASQFRYLKQNLPLNNGHKFGVSKVVVLLRFDCTLYIDYQNFNFKFQSNQDGSIL